MAVVHADGRAYLFDSHSRGPKGGLALNGAACIFSFSKSDAPKEISMIIHRNVPTGPVP